MSWKKFILGEKMPDKDDPKYKKRYENEVDAGRRFARWSHIDDLVAKIMYWALTHQKSFLCIVLSFIIGCFIWNCTRIYRAFSVLPHHPQSVIERQEHLLDSLRQQKDNTQKVAPHQFSDTERELLQETIKEYNKTLNYESQTDTLGAA